MFLPLAWKKNRRSTRRKNQPTSFFLLVFPVFSYVLFFHLPFAALVSVSPLVESVALSHVWCSLYSQHACKTLSSATRVLHCRNDIASFSSGFCCFVLVSASVMWWARIMMGENHKTRKTIYIHCSFLWWCEQQHYKFSSLLRVAHHSFYGQNDFELWCHGYTIDT